MLRWLYLVFTFTGHFHYFFISSHSFTQAAISAHLGFAVNVFKSSDPSNFTSNMIVFHFFAAFSFLLARSPFQLFILVQCCVGLSLSDKEAIQLHALLSVNRVTDTQRLAIESWKGTVLCHWSWCMAVIYTTICGLSKVCTVCRPSQRTGVQYVTGEAW